jgi:magnesium transporter
MLRTLCTAESQGFTWHDIVDPSPEELGHIAEKYSIHSTSVQDCLDPAHLPKIEVIENTLFFVTRAFDEKTDAASTTIQELTFKVAVFVCGNTIVTIHRRDHSFLAQLRTRWASRGLSHRKSPHLIFLSEFLKASFQSFLPMLDAAEDSIENFEEEVFRPQRSDHGSEQAYFIKRRVSTVKKLLRLNLDVARRLDLFDRSSLPFYRDLIDEGERLFVFADELVDTLASLLNTQISFAAGRQNEIMRILTVFSVFFMPLNFIAGVYGMNFAKMPELDHPLGYPAVLLAMFLVGSSIFGYFWRKGWLTRPR